MKTALTHYFQADLFWQLLRAKCTNMRRTLIDKFINFYIWATCSLFVGGYLMQAFGMSKDFGPFQLGGILATVGVFELYGNAVTIVSDIEGDRTIDYYLSLPTSVFTVLASRVVYYAMIGFTMGLCLLPLAKVLLGERFVLGNVSWFLLVLFLLLINFVCATATLLLSAYVPSMDKFDIVWVRMIFPLWFLGGFQFSWASVHQTSPWFANAMLLNPITYFTEGMRAALLGSPDSLPLWLCSLVLVVMWVVVGFWGYKALKKRLDFV